MKKPSKIWIGAGIVAVVAIASWLLSGGKKEQQITFDTAKVQPANIKNSVTATGSVKPKKKIKVGKQEPGIIPKLPLDYNTPVKRGQVIAELDKTNLISELNTAKANLASAHSTLSYESANFKRYATPYRKGLVSADEYDSAKLNYEKAKESVASSREMVQKAQTNLGYAIITSPIDGVVISKSVEEGQTVAASYATPELFTIAKDLKDMQVVADVDEADIGDVK